MRLTNYIAPLILGLALSCVKPYDFDPDNFDRVLVIEGQISDEQGPHRISITYTYPLDTLLNEFVSGATVWVEDGNGVRTPFVQIEGGFYQSPEAFAGQVGQTYQLHIELPDGSAYESSSELLQAAPAIDAVYGKYTEQANSAGDQNTGGIQFFIDSETSDHAYYRYSWEEGYKIETPYPARYMVTDDSMLVLMDTSIGICYKEGFSTELIYGTTNNSTVNRMVEFPIRYLSDEQQQLRVRYSILVKQYAINESAYLFYKQLDENNESGGSLFDQQNGTVIGNISSTSNSGENVLGYFEAAGVSKKRAFFNDEDLDEQFDRPRFPYACHYSLTIVTSADSALYYVRQGGNVFSYDPFLNEVQIQSISCTDCSFYADTTPPNYWEE
ncbi:DUF4249 domain-containing protein [Marinoscillum sp.]|uniref:DUF4249 domain-containing protein n=1 Tax=Marinoscillum sp. TaxID=2024838 RepID=UPI003BAD8BC1